MPTWQTLKFHIADLHHESNVLNDLVRLDYGHSFFIGFFNNYLVIVIWTMLQHNADFRWMRGRSDSPWYRSMTLIRQRKLGDWDSVFEQIQNNLVRLLGSAEVEVNPG